ncbi:MAG TPA: hypothetical protein VII74_09555 [Chthoniobacterales bacterium]
MKKSILLACAVLCAGSALAQSPAPNDQQQITDLLKTIQAQQAQIAQNQADIDTKLAAVAETVRLAKIYASRGGR